MVTRKRGTTKREARRERRPETSAKSRGGRLTPRQRAARKGWETRRRRELEEAERREAALAQRREKDRARRAAAKARRAEERAARERRSLAAKRAWETRRRREREALEEAEAKRLARSEAARKGWEKRRAKAASIQAAKERDKRRRSEAARRGWEKRRAREEGIPAPPPPEKAPIPPPLEEQPPIARPDQDPREIRLYFADVLQSACAELKTYGVQCQPRTRVEGDGSVSGQLRVPAYGLDTNDGLELLLATYESLRFQPLEGAYVSFGFRLDTQTARRRGGSPNLPERGTYVRATRYHRLRWIASAYLTATEILNAVKGDLLEIIVRVRWNEEDMRPIRPRS